MRHPTDDELLKRRPVSSKTLDRAWHEREPQRHPREQESRQDKNHDL
jgi:hypothetical protein